MTSKQSDHVRRSKILLDATVQFCNQRNRTDAGVRDQYSKIFYSLIGETDAGTKKLISSRLARCHHTPRAIAYYLAMEPIEIASPFLLISPVFWERDLLQLVERVDVAALCVIARRSDINAKIAQAIVSRGDKLSCRVLSSNPILKLNSLVLDTNPLPGSIANGETGTTSGGEAHDRLMELARASGKIGSGASTSQPSLDNAPVSPDGFAARLLEYAKANNREMIAKEIATLIDMPVQNVDKLVQHESSASLAIFLKGLNLNRSQASQLLLLINKRTGQNIAEYTRSMAQFDRFSLSQSHDIMKNLGAKNLIGDNRNNIYADRESGLGNVAMLRRRQIMAKSVEPLFGIKRKAGQI